MEQQTPEFRLYGEQMPDKSQTAVDWLEEGLNTVLTHEQQVQVIGLFLQAKEIEKQQIITAWKKPMGSMIKHQMNYPNNTTPKPTTYEILPKQRARRN